MAKTRRRKKRTHAAPDAGGQKKVPKSLVVTRGTMAAQLTGLEADVKKMLLPHTAQNLRTRKSNTLKDFVSVCGPLGVSHLVMLSATSAASYLRIARTPHGPTVTFRVESYALTRDVVSVQRRPREPGHAFTHPPLVVLHGF